MWKTYWFEINDEESSNCGYEFFVEIFDDSENSRYIAENMANELFPDDKIHFLGRVSEYEAEMMGLDTY